MGAALQMSGSRRGPPQRAVVSTPSPPASESVLRPVSFASRNSNGEAESTLRRPTGWLSRVCSSLRAASAAPETSNSGYARERKAAMTGSHEWLRQNTNRAGSWSPVNTGLVGFSLLGRWNVKQLTFLVVAWVLLAGVSSAQVGANDGCTLEQTTDFQTAVALAVSDYYLGMTMVAAKTAMDASMLLQETLHLQKAYEAALERAVNSLPQACQRALSAAAAAPSDQCKAPLEAAAMKRQQPLALATQQYLQTGDRAAFETSTRENVKAMLQSLPRACWYQSLSAPQPGPNQPDNRCPQLWSQYDRCVRDFKMCIASGGRACSYTCVRPSCSR